MTNNQEAPRPSASTILKNMSPHDFLALGVEQLAYLKPVMIDGTAAWALHAADGRPLLVQQSADDVLTAAYNNELRTVRVH